MTGVSSDDLTLAISLACQAHRGQSDKGGGAYILHPLRLMMRFTEPKKMIVAVLHDAVEDGDVTLEMLAAAGFSDEVVAAIDCLTRREGESYDQFIARVATNELARTVKIEDLRDNMDLTRLTTVGEKELVRVAKYHAALQSLQAVSSTICR